MKLKEVCEINPRTQGVDDSTTVSFVPMPSVSEDGKIDTSDIRSYQEVKKGYTVFQENDVLFAKITPCMENGKGAIARGLMNGIGYGSSEFHVLRANSEMVCPEWIYYLTAWKQFRTEAEKHMTGSAGQRRVPKTYLENYNVNVPSLAEQTRETKLLCRLQQVIDYRKRELQKLDELIKARFVEMFGDPVTNSKGWSTKRFDEICENLDSRRKPITASEREAGVYPYYGASGVVDHVADYIFDEDILLVSEDGANLLMRSTPIAFSVSGKVWVNNHAHVVRFESMSLQKYIEVYFSMIDISDQITGSAQPKLNQAKLNAMQFGIPDENLMDEYYEFVKQLDKSKSVVQKALDESKLLFDSLMQKYFG